MATESATVEVVDVPAPEPAPEPAMMPPTAPKLPQITVGAAVASLVPTTFEDYWRMAKLFAASTMVPKDYRGSAENCMLAMMHGAELGLPPIQAIQSIAVINGRPSVWGDAMLAIVRRSGLLEWIEEVEVEADGVAICRVKRRGARAPVQRSFSHEDARKAGLAGKEGPWQGYEARMRMFRARSWALRDEFGDVLKGIFSAEEMMDSREMRDVTPALAPPPSPPSPPSAPKPPAAPKPASVVAEAEVAEAEAAVAPVDPERFLEQLAMSMATAPDEDSLNEVWLINESTIETLPPASHIEAGAAFERRLAQIRG